ncbi:RO60 protein, partial [Acromyrmex heyeri]
MATEGNSNDPELRLLRYLYVGKDYPNYQPGYWFAHHYFIVRNVLAIEELAEDKEKQLVPIELITKAFKSNLVTHPEALVFALAVCCRQNKSETLRHAAYESVQTICASTPNFILFVKFVSKLCREKELNYITQGWGHGLRKAINNWYLSKKPLDFIECVTKYKSRYGWKHKDIVKMAHPLGNSPESKIILKYVIHGLEKIKKDMAADQIEEISPNINELLKYMEEIEDFKHCEDEVRAASMLETFGFSLDHVPGHLLKSKEVWNSLLISMDIVVLLNNLQRIHNLGFLVTDEPAVEKVTERLTNSQYVERSAIHPALIFITLKNYQCSGKCLTYEKRKVRELAKKSVPPGFDPNIKIMDALNEAFHLSFKLFHKLCSLIIINLIDNITIATFKNVGIYILNVYKTDSFEDILKTLKTAPLGSSNQSKPILWAKKQSKQYDVFINIIDQILQKHDESQENLISYKEHLNLPDTKLITCALCSPSPYRKEHYDRHVLTINGFDATVPNVIEAFAKGLF